MKQLLNHIIFIVVLLSITPIHLYPQDINQNDELVEISDIIPESVFRAIRRNVWEKGDRKTYCPNYADNPHYLSENDTIEVYLNPALPDQKQYETDYNVIYIVSKLNNKPFNYYLYMTRNGIVYLYDYKNTITDESTKEQVINSLKNILSTLKDRFEN